MGKRLDARRSATQPELHVSEVGEILLGVDGTVHGHEVDIAPRPLQRMRGIERRGAAHGEQRVDDADGQLRDAGKVAQGARQMLQRIILRRVAGVDGATQ